MMNLKGVVVGSLLFVVVELVLLFRSIPPSPPDIVGHVGYDVVTMFRNLGWNGPMFWIELLVLMSICSRFFPQYFPQK